MKKTIVLALASVIALSSFANHKHKVIKGKKVTATVCPCPSPCPCPPTCHGPLCTHI